MTILWSCVGFNGSEEQHHQSAQLTICPPVTWLVNVQIVTATQQITVVVVVVFSAGELSKSTSYVNIPPPQRLAGSWS